MPVDFSVPIEGLRIAERSLSEAAHKIAAEGQPGNKPNSQAPPAGDSVTWSMNVDFAAALLQADQAKIAAEANLKLIDDQQKVEKGILDIFK